VRALRLALFFVVGLLFGGAVTFAYAQQQLNGPARYGSSINFNYPDGINAPRRTGGPIYDFPDAPDGWGKMRDINRIKMGSHTFDVHGVRKFSPGTLAKIGAGFAKKVGPLGIGWTIGELVWDEAQGWLIPGDQETPDGWGWYFEDGNPENRHPTPEGVCQELANLLYGDHGLWFVDPGTQGNFVCRHKDIYQASYRQKLIRTEAPGNCESPYVWNPDTRFCEAESRPATDQELEDAIYVELVSRGMGSDLARRLIEAGYTPTPDGHEADGPTTVPGETTTTTTTSPAGTTTTTTNTTNNLTYNTNTTNNTTTITITQTTTTTTTNPDGTQTESTETKQPQPGEREEPEQYSLTYSPSSLPEVPDFYEQKYPDGFAGEWDGFKQRIDGSSLANFMRSLTNGIPSGGECPSWSLTFNFGAMGNFGTMVMQPPCIIWPFIKAVMILSALFVARRLVIGG